MKYTQEEYNNIQKTKQMFKDFNNNLDFVIEKLNDMQETKGLAEQLNSNTTNIGISHQKKKNSKIENAITKADEITQDYKEIIQNIINEKIDMTLIANKMPKPFGEIIFYKYIKRYTWEEVGRKTGYEREVINRKNNEALLRFYKISHSKSQ